MKAVNYGYSHYSVGDIEDFFIRVVNEIAEMWPIREDHLTKNSLANVEPEPTEKT